MATEILLALIRANLCASAAIFVVMLLRTPARRLFGPRNAYALWLAVPAAMLGSVFAASTATDSDGTPLMTAPSAGPWLDSHDHAVGVLAVWLFGVVAALGMVAWSQHRFMAAARAGRAGPAVTGIVHARLIAPSDFAQRFTPEERRLVRAHERVHIDRLDVRANAWAVLVQCLGWFNPFLHLAAHAMRLDQELACDAAVIARLPRERRRYAETLLKSHLDRRPLPLGCHWRARGVHPLEARIAMLAQPAPSGAWQDIGAAVLTAIAIAALGLAWALQPPQPPWLALVITAPIDLLFALH